MADMNDQEKQLVAWLADMNEDDAFALAKKMLLEEGAKQRVTALVSKLGGRVLPATVARDGLSFAAGRRK